MADMGSVDIRGTGVFSGWKPEEYEGLIGKLVEALAKANGRTISEESMYWPLPNRPPVRIWEAK